MTKRYRFNRMELAGSLGDLGTLLPMALGMILLNGLAPSGVFLSIGIFYMVSGWYFGVTVPVQPMKVIGAYAIATAMEPSQIMASCALMGIFLLFIGGTGAITVIGRYVPKATIRGVQLSTGVLLMTQGIKFMLGTSRFQELAKLSEPFLHFQRFGPLPAGIVMGAAGFLLTLLLLENRRFPAAIVVVLSGAAVGLFFGTGEGLADLSFGLFLPGPLPFGFPGRADFTFALFALVLPQLPMTLGNAVIANADLSRRYFGDTGGKVTYRALALSMAFANFLGFLLGGIPLCHGAGGLAAHYRFGARTAGSNLMIGVFFAALGLFLGPHALPLLNLLPMAILGVLLLFAGSQLALTVVDLSDRGELFVALLILGVTLAANLAAGFCAGIFAAWLLKWRGLKI